MGNLDDEDAFHVQWLSLSSPMSGLFLHIWPTDFLILGRSIVLLGCGLTSTRSP